MTDIRQRLISAAENARSSQFGAPASICIEAADEIGRLRAAALSPEPTEGLLAALKTLVGDVQEYERVNNLAPNPGRRHCWVSVEHALAVIAKAEAAAPVSLQDGGRALVERCAQIAEQTETWMQMVEETDCRDIYTGTYSSVARTTPKWRDGKAIAAAIRQAAPVLIAEDAISEGKK